MARARAESGGTTTRKATRGARTASRKDGRKESQQKPRGKASARRSADKPDEDAPRKKTSRLADARARMYREVISESAECIFGRQGYDGATMQEIADEAGVSLKTVYATFENKKDLYDGIMRRRAASFVHAMRQALDEDLDPLGRLTRIIETYISFLLEHEDWLRIHLRSRVAWAFRPADEQVAESWSEARDAYSQIIREGMEQGVFHEGDPEEMGVLVQSIMQLQMARAVEMGRREPDEVAQMMMVPITRLLCR